MIQSHLPALQVIVPLVAAPLCFFLLRFPRIAWVFATLVSWLCFFIAIVLLGKVQNGAELSYYFGGWLPPWGIEFKVDLLNAFILLIVSGIASVVLPYSWTSIQKEIAPERQTLFFTAFLLCLGGSLGIIVTADAFNVFVLLEIASLASYTLISLGRDRRALVASFQYLIMGTIGATFILIGIGFLYVITGTLNIADLAEKIPELYESRTLQVAFGFIVLGFGLKIAMFPLHFWLPNAYAYSPSVVSAFLAATATKVSIYAFIRFLYTLFGAEFSFEIMHLHWLFILMAVSAMIIASVVAVFQQNVKRLLAFSSVAQIGYILLGLGLLNVTGLTGALLHMFNHALIKGALFLTLGAVYYRLGHTTRLADMAGLAKQMPWTMAAFVIGGLSLIGVPLTAGFISKWYLILASIEKGWWFITVVILISSLIAVVYFWRIVEVVYLKPIPEGAPKVKEAPLSLLIPIWILVAANIVFGVNASFSAGLAESIAQMLFLAGN